MDYMDYKMDELTKAITGKQVLSIQNIDGRGQPDSLVLTFSNGTTLTIKYDYLYSIDVG